MKKIYYFDYAAAAPLEPEVLRAMMPYLTENFGNPSSFHYIGKKARDAVENYRAKIAGILNCEPREIIFTSGGTEANNIAVIGGVAASEGKGNGLIVSSIEHHSVLKPAERLHETGFNLKIAPVKKDGLVDVSVLRKLIDAKTVLVSVMYANNEIGVIQDVKRISEIVKSHNEARNRKYKKKSRIQNTRYPRRPDVSVGGRGRRIQDILFHTDACAAAGWLDLNVKKLGVDMLSLSAQKFYGPKGIGALYVREGVKINPLFYGGFQERGRRPGTENVAGVIGMAAALELAEKRRENESVRLSRLRDYATARIIKEIPKLFLNGSPEKRLPNSINITILDIEGEGLVSYLAERGIFVSTGSACISESLEPSHVILALGHSYEAAHGSVRMTLGRETKKKDVDFLIRNLKEGVEFLRRISPVRLKIV